MKKLLTERFQELAGIKPLHEKSFPDLTGDGNVTYADVLKGRGVDLDYSEVSEEEDMCEACGMAHEGSCGMEESYGMLNEKWVLKPWVKQVITIGKAIGNIISAWGWCCGSDSRLKKNIKLVGESPSGTNIYEFEYKNKARYGGGVYRGVLAQEVPKSAVIMEGGYRYVNYNKLDVDFVEVKPTSSRLLNNINNILQEQRMEKPNMGIDPMEPGREEMEMDPRGDGRGMENEKRSIALQAELSALIPSLDEMVVDMTSTIPNDKEALAQTGWTQEYADMAVELSNIIKDAYNTMSSTGTISQTTYTTAVSFKKGRIKKLLRWFKGLFMVEVPDFVDPTNYNGEDTIDSTQY